VNARVDFDLAGTTAGKVEARVAAIEWDALAERLDERGHGVIRRLLAPEQCSALVALYRDEAAFRSRIVMSRHGFGRGEYKYFRYPLPPLVAALRGALYPYVVPIANRWNQGLGIDIRFPPAHAEFVRRCHAAGQRRPTPLLLQYGPGDYNCLHQDLYGEHVFPLQVAVLLAEPGRDFAGGASLAGDPPGDDERTALEPGIEAAAHARRGDRGMGEPCQESIPAGLAAGGADAHRGQPHRPPAEHREGELAEAGQLELAGEGPRLELNRRQDQERVHRARRRAPWPSPAPSARARPSSCCPLPCPCR